MFLLLMAYALAALNFYIVVLRYPFYLWRGGKREDYRFFSVFAVFGNLCILLALLVFPYSVVAEPWVATLIIVALLVDLGGIPWAIICVLIASLHFGITRCMRPRK